MKVESAKLLKDAGIKDSFVAHVEPVGYGQAQAGQFSVFENFPSDIKGMYYSMLGKFHEAVGVYKTRTIETINPFYWVEFIIFLPKYLLEYIGISQEKSLTKIIQITYWIISLIFGLLYATYKPEIQELIKKLIVNVSKS